MVGGPAMSHGGAHSGSLGVLSSTSRRTRLGLLGVLTGVGFAAGVKLVPSSFGSTDATLAIAAFVAGVLGVTVLRSISLPVVVRGLLSCGLAAVWFLGNAAVGGGEAVMLIWVGGAVSALVLQAVVGSLARLRVFVAPVIAVLALVLGASLVGGPLLGDSIHPGSSRGRVGPGPLFGQTGGLTASAELNMTRRPELTDKLLFTVKSLQPSFWRTQTYEDWDGSVWRNPSASISRVAPSGDLTTQPFDQAAKFGDSLIQEVRIEAPAATALPAAPSAVNIDVDGGVSQSTDGSVLSLEPLGRGAVYTVQSRRIPVTASGLAASIAATPSDGVGEEVLARFAAPPQATERVRQLATQIGATATTPYEKVKAIEALLGERTEYSLDAPLSPEGTDVVDHFLFESKLGWCEQIASSFVVLARLNGLPARVATGYVPGEFDPLSRRYKVREYDAHAWAEVWFPEFGWVPFDPTANVPLAGESVAADLAERILNAAGWILLIGGGLLMGLPAIWGVLGSLRQMLSRRRRGSRRGGEHVSWARRTERELERIGLVLDRPQHPAETASQYGRALAELCVEPELVEVGDAIDVARFGAVEFSPEVVERTAAILARVTAEVQQRQRNSQPVTAGSG